MFEQLEFTEKRYQEINEKLMDPAVVSDNEQYVSLMKEYKNLTPIVEKYREYSKAKADFEEAKALLEEGGLDKDFKEIVQEEFETNKELLSTLEEEMKRSQR